MTEQRGWPYEPVDRTPPPAAADPRDAVALSVRDPHAADAPPTEPSVRPRLLIALAVVAALAMLLSCFAVVDWFSRNRELDLLLDRIEKAEAAQIPARDTLAPYVIDCQLTLGECDKEAISRVANRYLPDLQATGDIVARTRLTRYHGALQELRDRYVEHSLAWQSWLQALASGTVELDRSSNDIERTFREAGRAARDAVPVLALNGASDRVSEIFD